MRGPRIKELLALMMIGEGITMMFQPRRHMLLWRFRPKLFRKVTDAFIRHPELTRLCGLLEGALGLWWASRQYPRKRGIDLSHTQEESFLC